MCNLHFKKDCPGHRICRICQHLRIWWLRTFHVFWMNNFTLTLLLSSLCQRGPALPPWTHSDHPGGPAGRTPTTNSPSHFSGNTWVLHFRSHVKFCFHCPSFSFSLIMVIHTLFPLPFVILYIIIWVFSYRIYGHFNGWSTHINYLQVVDRSSLMDFNKLTGRSTLSPLFL